MHKRWTIAPEERRVTSERGPRRAPIWLAIPMLLAGCLSAPRPVPQGGQEAATVEGQGVVLTVPRLESEAYPGDVLERAAAVYVLIENRSPYEVVVAREDFTLGEGPLRQSPVAAQLLAARAVPATPATKEAAADEAGWLGAPFAESLLAGPVVGGSRGMGGGFGGGGRIGGGSFGGGGVRVGGGGFGGGFRGGAVGGPVYGGFRGGVGVRRPGVYGYDPRLMGYGSGYGYGYGLGWGRPYYWDPLYHNWIWLGQGSRPYGWSREEAARLELPAARLAPGGRTAGFLYFPHQQSAPSTLSNGASTALRWTVREAQSKTPIAYLTIPLTISDQ